MTTTTTADVSCGDVDILNKMSFEELRKRARQLEGDVDAKLVTFSKLASSYGSSKTNKVSADSVPLISPDDL